MLQNMSNFNFQSKPIPTPTPLGVVDNLSCHNRIDRHQERRRPRSPRKLAGTGHSSSGGSYYSSQSLASHATELSTRTHRRCYVEVGSFLFGPAAGGSERATERTDIIAPCPEKPAPAARLVLRAGWEDRASDALETRGRDGAARDPAGPPPPGRASPPLPPKTKGIGAFPVPDVPTQVLHDRNRARSTSISISEMSGSCFGEPVNAEESSSKSGRSRGARSSEKEESSVAEKKSLITIENAVPPAQIPSSRPPASPLGRGRSLTVASDQSSYISSASSSSSDHASEASCGPVEDTEERGSIDVDDRRPNYETGQSSLEGGRCDACRGEGGAGRRLDSEALREWDAMCQEGLFEEEAVNRFIFRVLSCPDKMDAAACVRTGPHGNDDESAEGPHLVAASPSHKISQSLFSYTNSCAASTLSSRDDDAEGASSDLDFDAAFIYSRSIGPFSIVAC